jgi:hypothetical protein
MLTHGVSIAGEGVFEDLRGFLELVNVPVQVNYLTNI